MKIAFRTDASLQIGTGHVMRCLTLADAIAAQGADCHFISREHPGHLLEVIRQRGHAVAILPASNPAPTTAGDSAQRPAHAAWLGCDWQTDAQQTDAHLTTLRPDWLVVDHYALDQRWEVALQSGYKELLVIDDLADRPHRCNVLLDQNLGRRPQDYAGLVPLACKVLVGPEYALLRPEFAALRDYSLQRRQQPKLGRLLITMGGVDLSNATGQVLQALKACLLPQDCRITVVMGAAAPWLGQVRGLAAQMAWPTDVLVNISDMAQCMADSDWAIGAAGSTSWERCCLGLPTIVVVLADNQWPGAKALQVAGAACLGGGVSEFATQLPLAVQALTQGHRLMRVSNAASAVADGRGVYKVLQALGAFND